MSILNPRPLDRPPTPTRNMDIDQVLDDTLDFLGTDIVEEHRIDVASMTRSHHSATPDNTPADAPTGSRARTSARRSTGSTAKKVLFAPVTDWNYHGSPDAVASGSPGIPLKTLAPSRQQRRAARPILKPFKQAMLNSLQGTSGNGGAEARPHDLEHAMGVLDSGSTEDKLEVYGSLLAVASGTQTLPEGVSLLLHIDRLQRYCLRDAQYVPNDDLTDFYLPVSAMKLLMALARIPEMAARFDPESMARFLETSIGVLQGGSNLRIVLNHHLSFLSQQKLGPKIMTADRANRLITCLAKIHTWITGNNIKSHRLMVLRRLFIQHEAVMRSRLEDWIALVYESMVSEKQELRTQAFELAYEFAHKFGQSSEVNRVLNSLLEKDHEGDLYRDLLIHRLQQFRKLKDVCVPRVWTVTLLLSRSRLRTSGYLHWFKPFLQVINQCLNTTDRTLKIETNKAWTEFIYACYSEHTLPPETRKLIKIPVESQLQRENDFTKPLGRSAVSTYYCLLYYSFRPMTTNSEQLDQYWDDLVAEILLRFIPRHQPQSTSLSLQVPILPCKLDLACSVLQTLIHSPSKIADKRPNTPLTSITLDDISMIDPRWTRSRTEKIFNVLLPFLRLPETWQPLPSSQSSSSDGSNPEPQRWSSRGMSTWMSLMDAVREASAKDITTTPHLKEALCHIVSALHQIAYVFRTTKLDNGSRVFGALIDGTMQRIGSAPFSERILVRSGAEAFEVAPTPSHRPRSGVVISPITHIFGLQLSIAPELSSQRDSAEVVCSSISRCWKGLKQRTAKLEFLVELAGVVSTVYGQQLAPRSLLIELTDLILELAEETTRRGNDQQDGLMKPDGIRSTLEILSFLIPMLTADRLPQSLYKHMVTAAQVATDEGGVLIAVTEPQAETITQMMARDSSDPALLLLYAALILDNDNRPRPVVAERAQKRFFGGPTSSSRGIDLDLNYTKVWSLISTSLTFGYDRLLLPDTHLAYTRFLEALSRHINRSVRSFHTMISIAQDGLSYVLLDETRKIKDVAASASGRKVKQMTLSLWSDILDRFRREFTLTAPLRTWLHTVETLLSAGLNSPRQSVVNVGVVFWNNLMDLAKHRPFELDFPPRLVEAVRRLQNVADVHLPDEYASHDEADADDDDDDNDDDLPRTYIAFSDYGSQLSASPETARKPPFTRVQQPSPPDEPTAGPTAMPTAAAKQTPPRKLRHDNSQIHFQPILPSSSPAPNPVADESQHLTTHQRDVAARQRATNEGLFRHLAAEPPRAHATITSDLVVASSDGSEQAHDSSPPATPLLAHGGDVADEQDDVPSSPVAASVSRRSERRSSSSGRGTPRRRDEQHQLRSNSHGEGRETLDSRMTGETEFFAEERRDCDMVEAPSDDVEVVMQEVDGEVVEDTSKDVQDVKQEVEEPQEDMADDQQQKEELEAEAISTAEPATTVPAPSSQPTPTTEKPAPTISDPPSDADLPTSQLMMEMLASQSSRSHSPAPTIPLSHTDGFETGPTQDLLRGLQGLDDLYPDGDVALSSQQQPARQRGRTRRTMRYLRSRSLEEEEEEEASAQTTEPSLQASAQSPPPANTSAPSSQAPSIASEESVASQYLTTDSSGRRKRGRPRKSDPLPNEHASSNSSLGVRPLAMTLRSRSSQDSPGAKRTTTSSSSSLAADTLVNSREGMVVRVTRRASALSNREAEPAPKRLKGMGGRAVRADVDEEAEVEQEGIEHDEEEDEQDEGVEEVVPAQQAAVGETSQENPDSDIDISALSDEQPSPAHLAFPQTPSSKPTAPASASAPAPATEAAPSPSPSGVRALLSPKSIIARLRSLVADAGKVAFGRDEQRLLGDLAFNLQAASRGMVVDEREHEDEEGGMDLH